MRKSFRGATTSLVGIFSRSQMRVWPEARVKQLSECMPGELVALQNSNPVKWAFAARMANSSTLFLLALVVVDGRVPAPFFVGTNDTNVVAFGCEYEIATGMAIVFPHHDAPRESLFVDQEGWFILASPLGGGGWYAPLRYRIGSGLLVNGGFDNHCAAFSSWELRLPAVHGSAACTTVLSFGERATNGPHA